MHRKPISALAAALMLTACAVPSINITPPPGTTPLQPAGAATPFPVLSHTPVDAQRVPVKVGVTITGSVKVPAGIIAAGGLNQNGAGIVSAGAGNATGATGGAGIIAAGGLNYGLLAVEQEAAGGCRVFLADAAGNPIPDIDEVKTDAKGNYKIEGVPPDFTFVVAAEVPTKDGKKATFQTLAKPGKLGATAELDPATTMVAANLLGRLKGGDLGEFNPAEFKTAAEKTNENLKPEKLPDFTDRASVKAKMSELAETVKELKTSLDTLGQELSDIKKTLTDLRAELAKARETAAQQPPGMPPMDGTRPPNGTMPPPDGTRPPDGMMPPPNGTMSPMPFDPTRPPPTGTMSPMPFDPTKPPPTGTMSPLPPTGGQDPSTCARGDHHFLLDARDKVMYIEFKVYTPGKEPKDWINSGTAKRDVDYWTGIAEGCRLNVVFYGNDGAVLGVQEGFYVAPGSPKDIKLYLPGTAGTMPPVGSPPPTGTWTPPPTGTWTPPPTTGSPLPPPPTGTQPPPGGCTERKGHRIKVNNPSGAILMFDVPNSGDPPQHAAQGNRAADGTYEVWVPEGCAHDVKLFDQNWHWLGGIKGYTIPPGSPYDLYLEIKP